MKLSIIMQDDSQQIVLTPENDKERNVLDMIYKGDISTHEIELARGMVYECKGGYKRMYYGDNHSDLVLLFRGGNHETNQ